MLGEVPSGWSRVRVSDVVSDCYSGGSPTCEERHITPGEWGLLKTTAITWERGWDQSAHKVAPKELWGKKSQAVQLDDVLVTKAGPRHRVGVVAHVDRLTMPLLVSGKMIGLRPRRERVEPRVLAAALAGREAQAFLNERTSGMAESQVNFTNENLLLTTVLLPPFPEQKKIAAILSSVDEAIQATQAVIDQTRRVKEGLLQDLLTRGIGHTRFKQTEIGEIPEGWEVLPASSVCEAVIDCKNRTPPETLQGFSVVRTTNIRNGRFVSEGLKYTDPLSYEIWTQRGKPRPGDVLITREAPVGEVALLPSSIGPCCLGQRVMMYRPGSKLNNEYMLAALLSPQVQKYLLKLADGSTVGHVRVDDIRNLPIPVPPLEEQLQIAEVVGAVGRSVESGDAELAALSTLKSGLLTDLLTGKVRVTP
jgi:hypothetical protein